METLSLPRVAAIGATFGATIALGWMGALAARTAWAITSRHAWADVKRLAGMRYH